MPDDSFEPYYIDRRPANEMARSKSLSLEGGTATGIKFGLTDHKLLVLFDTPTSWLEFTPEHARAFAAKMVRGAEILEQKASDGGER